MILDIERKIEGRKDR